MLSGCPLDMIPQYSTSEQVKWVPPWLILTSVTDVDNSFAHMPKCRISL